MILTPSSTSAGIAGAGYWALLWTFLFKITKFPFLQWVPKDRILGWIETHKLQALIITEVVNLGTHSGILGVTFALGGTVVNSFVILVLFPFRAFLRNRKKIAIVA